MLRLRALASNGDLDEYFAFHEGAELERNHRSRYAESKPPLLVRAARARLRLVK